ncbi:uncharacterized protein LOC110467401 isoform X2 [Mizuhopecten yessoensis]|uniref:uncharacterized protein LOC110467401 isoform X2 n=1 Tax=Mizuhopecten yessoensis TaxID=6573 RepID=UPI000B45BC07|nr:uncharacterized protein LOC110467401 isoform X2 [Mizuhopecten yessoensis]
MFYADSQGTYKIKLPGRLTNMGKQSAFYYRIRRVFHASVVGNIVLVITIVVLYIVRQTLRDQNTIAGVTTSPRIDARTDIAGQICLTCDFQGHDTSDTLYEFIVKTENNNTLCCLQRDDDLQNLILELVEENSHNWYNNPAKTISETLRWWMERNHAAHLYPSFYHNGQTLSWNILGSKTSFLRNLTLSDDGRKITFPKIPGTGMYFVYAHHTFDFIKAATNRPSPIGVHNIYKHRSGLINGAPKRLWTAKFLCGVVKINMLDSIESQVCSFVPAENCTMKHIDRSPYANYFGILQLVELF